MNPTLRQPAPTHASGEARRKLSLAASLCALAAGLAMIGSGTFQSGAFGAREKAVSIPGNLPQALLVAKARWGFSSPVDLIPAPGIKTATAWASGGRCAIRHDGDAASADWWRSLRGEAALYIDLHELAHCQEQGTEGYARRRARNTPTELARSREVYADAMAFSALTAGKPPRASFLASFAKKPRLAGDAHDMGFAAACLLSLGASGSDEEKAQACADRATPSFHVALAAPRATP